MHFRNAILGRKAEIVPSPDSRNRKSRIAKKHMSGFTCLSGVSESPTLPSRLLHTNAEFFRAIGALQRKIPPARERPGAWLPSTEWQIHVDISSDIFETFSCAGPNWV